MSATMSSRERMLAAIRREGPDHVPFSPYIAQGPLFAEPLFWHNQVQRVERLLELGLDPTFDVWFPDPMPHPDVEIKTWREKKGSEILLTKEYHTQAITSLRRCFEHWRDKREFYLRQARVDTALDPIRSSAEFEHLLVKWSTEAEDSHKSENRAPTQGHTRE